MFSVGKKKKKKKKKERRCGGGQEETLATAKQRGCQPRHSFSSEDQPSSHSHHPVIKIIAISACVERTSPSSFLFEQNI